MCEAMVLYKALFALADNVSEEKGLKKEAMGIRSRSKH